MMQGLLQNNILEGIMNQKIRELAEQSGFFPVPDETESDLEYRAENARYERFAELIIKECIKRLNSVDGYYYSEFLKEHFGIE